ncbi:hypothetical protein [Legionella cardiaca]|uniref:Dot/Icm T4SS effector n=1 Tax=Legionella cardiaca TaxID=1071983 RepID=A0ABY8ATN2_9GAMM|nr:hypothetical protein [Legionella cardiaca]WED44029.1 hypothetical protein PXX05_04380 [Legionella cardiaca]
MPFNIPTLNELIEAAKNLDASYKEERLSMDNNRYLSFLRKNTNNLIRKSDIKFIATFAGNVESYSKNYYMLGQVFANSYILPEDINGFLKRVLAGAFLFHLSQVNNGYMFESSVKDSSALAKITLNLFGVDNFSEIPRDALESCLDAFKTYFKVVTNKSGVKLKWHDSKTNNALYKEILKEMDQLNISTSTLQTP